MTVSYASAIMLPKITPNLEQRLKHEVCEVARQGLMQVPSKSPNRMLSKLAKHLVGKVDLPAGALSQQEAYRFATELLGQCRVALTAHDVKSAVKEVTGDENPLVDTSTVQRIAAALQKGCEGLRDNAERGAQGSLRTVIKLLVRDMALEEWSAMQVSDAMVRDMLITLPMASDQIAGFLSTYISRAASIRLMQARKVARVFTTKVACEGGNCACSGACACACEGYANQDACACASVTAGITIANAEDYPKSTQVAMKRLQKINEDLEMLSTKIEKLEDQGVDASKLHGKRNDLQGEYDRTVRLLEGFGVKVAKNYPPEVERYVEEHKAQGMPVGKAWAIAWSRYCKYKNPGSEHCKGKDYFPGRRSSTLPRRQPREAGKDDARMFNMDPTRYTREERRVILRERPWLHPRNPSALEYAMDAMRKPLVNWQEGGSGKGAVFAAYNALHEDQKKALAMANAKVMPSSTVAFRSSMNGKTFPSSMKGQSLHVEIEPGMARLGPNHVRAYQVTPREVMIHPDIPGSPLGKGVWKWEREMILMPDANPKRLSDSQTAKILDSIAKRG